MASYKRLLRVISWASGIAAVLSLLLGVLHQSHTLILPEAYRHVIVGCWVLLPPIWFWSEWVWVAPNISSEDRDRIKHLHDLTRNMWVALVVVLVALFDITVFKQ